MPKATLATVKSFIKKNINNLTIIQRSKSDLIDELNFDRKEFKVDSNKYNPLKSNTLGLDGIWFVGGSRDFIRVIENGFEVSNCCSSFKIIKVDKV